MELQELQRQQQNTFFFLKELPRTKEDGRNYGMPKHLNSFAKQVSYLEARYQELTSQIQNFKEVQG